MCVRQEFARLWKLAQWNFHADVVSYNISANVQIKPPFVLPVGSSSSLKEAEEKTKQPPK